MTFNPNARLDTSQVEDRRGGGGGFGGGTGLAVGGGGLGLIVAIVAMLLGVNPGDVAVPSGYGQLEERSAGEYGDGGATLETECRTGADANRREDCRIVGFVNSVQAYWTGEFQRRGAQYRQARTRFFSGGTQTGCGAASSEVGPFYCPLDERVYIDLGFFDELRTRFGASGGPFAQAYVIAHEYGHHIQNLIDTLDAAQRDPQGPQSGAVRVELQADCFAGVWANHAVETGFLQRLTETEITDALDAAAAVGDDRIQESIQGRVNPERWTHGSAEQRQRWFSTGYRYGDLTSCDTFRGRV